MEAGTSAWGDWALPGQPAQHYEPPPPVPPAPRANPDDARNRRALALIIDFFVQMLGGVAAFALLPAGSDWMDTASGTSFVVVSGVASFAYFFVLEACFGQTLGKALMDVRVVDREHRPARPGRVFVRTLLRIVDHALLCLVGALATMISGKGRRRRIGDVAAGTFVVRQSQSGLPRGSEGAIAAVGIALALVPVIAVVSPARDSIAHVSPSYETRQVANRYLNAAIAGDGLAACREMSAGQRRAIVASATNAYTATASPADCAPHAQATTAADVQAYQAVGGGKLIVDRRGDAALAGTSNGPAVGLVRESDSWKVDALAAGYRGFMLGCTRQPARAGAEEACVCLWGEMRGNGVATPADMVRVERQFASGSLPGWLETAAQTCRVA